METALNERLLWFSFKCFVQICDGTINCDNESDETVDRMCDDGRFYCETRPNNSSPVNRLFVPRNLMFNGRFDCEDGSDECPSFLDSTDFFSSRHELIKSTALRVILWIIAPVSFFGNLLVLISTFCTFRKRKNMNEISRIHSGMIMSLSVSDGLMGVYLMVLCIISTIYSGHYCTQDKPWRTGSLCRVMGTLVMISSESSVLTLLIMGGFRLYTVVRPFEANFSKKTQRFVSLVMASSWTISIVLSAIPWFVDSFTSHVWFPGPFFLSDVVKVDAYASFFSRLGEIRRATNLTGNIYEFTNSANVTFTSQPIEGKGYFNFYSQHGVCLPNFFTTPGEAGWQLTIFLITFNFIAFLTMVVLYVLIFKLTSKKRTSDLRKNITSGAKLNYQMCKLQGRVARLLLTDFLCWIPLCITAYVHFGGVPVDKVMHAVSGIILLPINSALNPVLYSGVMETSIKAAFVSLKKRFPQYGLGKTEPSVNNKIDLHLSTNKSADDEVTATWSVGTGTPKLQPKIKKSSPS